MYISDKNFVIKERGWPGHFCCSYDCLYRRNTLISYIPTNTNIVVSTVGNYYPSHRKRGERPEKIGYERHFETMVFPAEKEGHYWDTDFMKQIYLDDVEWALKYTDENEDYIDNLADEMHENIVLKVIELINKGEIKYE